MGTEIYDPRVVNAELRTAIGSARSSKELSEIANNVCAKVLDERTAAGVPAAEVFYVPVIHRLKQNRKTGRPILRRFDLSPGYPGRQNQCEELVLGNWRLASPAEVEAEESFGHDQSVKQDEQELMRLEREQEQRTSRIMAATEKVEKRRRELLDAKKAERPASVVTEKPASGVVEKPNRRA